jgi:ferrochelatase
LSVIPCLNDRDDFAQVLANIVEEWRVVDVETAIA